MKHQQRRATALVTCLGLIFLQSASAESQRDYQIASDTEERVSNPFASYNSFDDSYGSDLSGYDSNDVSYDSSYEEGTPVGGSGIRGRSGRFFIGADYLNIRSTFSESTAFVVTTGLQPPANAPAQPLFPPVTNTFQEFDYDYESSYRIFGGYRLDECGGEIRFAFTRFDNIGATAVSPPAVSAAPGGSVTQIQHPGELASSQTGDRIVASSNVNVKSYDLGFAKTIPLGSPVSGGCDSCSDGYESGCGWCPAWDVKWSAGIRFAEVNWDRQSTLQSTNGTESASMNFEGGGARVGLEGTRYLGRQQRFAVFAKSDMSLLLGTVRLEQITGVGTTPGITTRFSSTQLIPVLDIEAGGTFFVTDRLTVSAGYLFSAWVDLGMRDTFDMFNGTGPMFDDANILGFDGYFTRAEFAF